MFHCKPPLQYMNKKRKTFYGVIGAVWDIFAFQTDHFLSPKIVMKL